MITDCYDVKTEPIVNLVKRNGRLVEKYRAEGCIAVNTVFFIN